MSLVPAKFDFTLPQGTTFKKSMTYWLDKKAGIAKDLTGYTARMQIRTFRPRLKVTEPPPEDLLLMELSTANARIKLGNAKHNIIWTIALADTNAINWDLGSYDMELTSPANEVDRLLYGTVTVTPQVTV